MIDKNCPNCFGQGVTYRVRSGDKSTYPYMEAVKCNCEEHIKIHEVIALPSGEQSSGGQAKCLQNLISKCLYFIGAKNEN